ncbi:MAG: hypothetical protein M9897_04620 [Brumimicrobium sp.]|nr:hypothetical protein [Brumimicrobium sp.]
MYWIEFRRYIIIFFIVLLVVGCDSNTKVKEADKVIVTIGGEEYIRRKIESKLQISSVEKYDIQLFSEYLNEDTLKDVLILVNRKDFAFQHAKANKSEVFFEKTIFTAPYNYVFVLMGGDKELISTTPIGSNVNYPLNIHFLKLTSEAKTDFYIEYRVRNSLYRNYYTLKKDQLYLTFNCPVFDEIGRNHPKVYEIEHAKSKVRIAKDIALYQGELEGYNPKSISDTNYYTPQGILRTDSLVAYFIFNEKIMKYVTPMKPIEKIN